jgi:putative ABC transport system permease protein
MVSAFHLNLTALSFISLVVGMFLIYNAISTSVIQRRREIGILRSIGVTRPQVLGLLIYEAGIIGMMGSLIGLGMGIGLAKVMLFLVSRTITALYILVKADHLTISSPILIAGFGWDFAFCDWPAGAAKVAPREALGEPRNESEEASWRSVSRLSASLSFFFALQKPVTMRPLMVFFALLILIGISFRFPQSLPSQPASLAPLLPK